MSETSKLPSSGATSHGSQKRMITEPDEPQGITAGFVFSAVRQWWKVAVPIGLTLAIGAATLVYVFFEPVYVASAWIRIHEKPPSLVFPDKDDRTQLFVQTQIELMRSPMVLGPVVSEPEIARLPEIQEQEDPIQGLSRQIRVEQVGESELFKVSYASPVAANSALIVNAVVTQYFNLRKSSDTARKQRVIELLEKEKVRRSDEVARLRESVRQLTTDATGKDPFAAPDPELPVPHALAELLGRLVIEEVEREVLKAQIKALEETLSESAVEVPEGMVEQVVEEDAEIQRPKRLIKANRSKLRDIETKSAQGTESPSYKQLSDEIDQDEETLNKLKEELQGQIKTKIKTAMEAALANTREENLATMKAKLKDCKVKETALRAHYESELKKLVKGSGETVELEFARAELAQAQQVLNLITTRLLQIRVEQQAPAQVTLSKRASVPKKPVQLVPYRNMALASLAALCLPFIVAVFWERMVRRVVDIQCLERESSLAVVGEIPRLPTRAIISPDSSLKRVGQELWLFEESIDSLRTTLVLSDELRDMKVLAVTSAGTDEGKTSVAAQLAVSIARASGQPTLLIDGDMRSPDVHNVFDIPLEPGLAEVLSNQATIKDAIVTSSNDSVDLLPAGKLRTNPHKLVGNGAWDSLLARIPAMYRYVILDTPPILAASEALVLAKAADATLVCTMRNVSRIARVRKACERLVAAGSRPVGTVLNGIPTKRYERRYGSYAYSRD